MTTKRYKQHKGLKKENLRDNMSNIELALNMLAEASATEISRQQNPGTFPQHAAIAQSGGNVAKAARRELESKLGRTVITDKRAADYLPGNLTKQMTDDTIHE